MKKKINKNKKNETCKFENASNLVVKWKSVKIKVN